MAKTWNCHVCGKKGNTNKLICTNCGVSRKDSRQRKKTLRQKKSIRKKIIEQDYRIHQLQKQTKTEQRNLQKLKKKLKEY